VPHVFAREIAMTSSSFEDDGGLAAVDPEPACRPA
jgi:hypothetical protein